MARPAVGFVVSSSLIAEATLTIGWRGRISNRRGGGLRRVRRARARDRATSANNSAPRPRPRRRWSRRRRGRNRSSPPSRRRCGPREPPVVLGAVALEEEAEVQQRMRQQLPVLEQQRDQQTADAAVAIEIRVDGLELHVREADAHQRRKLVVGMEVLLEVAQQPGQLLRAVAARTRRCRAACRRSSSGCGGSRRAACWHRARRASGAGGPRSAGAWKAADLSEASWRARTSARRGSCRLPPRRRWARSSSLASNWSRSVKRGLRAFDLRGEHGFLAHEAVEEPVERRAPSRPRARDERAPARPREAARPIRGRVCWVPRRQLVRHERGDLLACGESALVLACGSLHRLLHSFQVRCAEQPCKARLTCTINYKERNLY